MSRKRILFFAEGATMAHFVRLLALADAAASEPYDIHFYAPRRFFPYFQNKTFATGELPTMPGEQFLDNIAKGAPLFSADVLRAYVRQDREIMETVRPDLVIGDMRPSLPLSARKQGIPCAVMINAYWSPYAKHRSIIPALPITRLIPPRFLGSLFRLTEPLAYRVHVGPMNRIRKELEIAPLPPDIRAMYSEGDYVLYPDIPEFVPASGAPGNHRYIGICEWSPSGSRPEWWDRMVDDPKPKVFIGLGSSGPLRVLPALMRVLSKLPVSTLISTSGRDLPAAHPATYVAGLLPLPETLRASDVVISNGGCGVLYPAMAAGTPALGIPSNADQHLSTAVLEENGGGLGVRIEEASEKCLRQALERLLFEPRYRASAQQWAAIYGRYDSRLLFRRFLSEVLHST